MSSKQWTRVRVLFDEALDLPPGERGRFLDEQCGEDKELRARVARLLETDGSLATGQLAIEQDLTQGAVESVAAELPKLAAGQRIGSYEIQRVLGSGGMSTVFEARQEHPQRLVALKTMRLGLLSREACRRFEYESEVLGRLRHPAIAQVYEAGTWKEPLAGQEVPFFAMEYVEDARPLTEFVRENHLDLQDTLELFLQVCDAVQYGHQLGFIHRDLKPANILVDGQGRPKVIDFGIARATESDRENMTMLTQAGHVLGTLHYMAPEQLEGLDDVDIRIDVYALGVILYELLCGKPPFDPGEHSLTTFARHLREHEPMLPSVAEGGFELSGLATDLDWITRRAMAADRDERYPSVSELAAEIGRFLGNEPVLAGPPSTAYYLRKFIRRNRVLVGSLSAVFAALALGLVTTIWQLMEATEARADAQAKTKEAEEETRKAERQTTKAETIATFFSEILKFADVREGKYASRRDWTIREVLDELSKRIDELASEPDVEAEIRTRLGDAYRTLEQFKKSERHLRRALELQKQLLGPTHPDTLKAMMNLGVTTSTLGKREDAIQLYRAAIAGLVTAHGEKHPDVALSHLNIGAALVGLRKLDEAERELKTAIQIYEELGDHDRFIAMALPHMALSAEFRKDNKQAMTLYEQAIVKFEVSDKAGHPTCAWSHERLGNLLVSSAKYPEATTHYKKAQEIYKLAFGPDSEPMARTFKQLGFIQFRDNNLAAAAEQVREAVRIFAKTKGDAHGTTINARYLLSASLRSDGRAQDALGVARRGFEGSRKQSGDPNCYLKQIATEYGRCLRDTGNFTEAEDLFRKKRQIYRQKKSQALELMTANDLALVLTRQDKLVEARELFEDLMTRAPKWFRKDDYRRGQFHRGYGECLMKLKRYGEAEDHYLEARRILAKAFGSHGPNVGRILEDLVKLCEASGDKEKLETYRKQLLTHRQGK